MIVAEKHSELALKVMQRPDASKQAVLIGMIQAASKGRLTLKGPFGASRQLDLQSGEQLPRIC